MQPGPIFYDPIGMALDEVLDAQPGKVQRSAHCQPSIAFDYDGNGLATGTNQSVNGYGHEAIVTESILNKL